MLEAKGETIKYIELGDKMMQEKKEVEAEKNYRAALQLAPNRTEIYGKIALSLMRQGKWIEVEAYSRRALEIEPKKSTGHFNLAYALKKQQKWKEAETEYKEAIKLDPNKAFLHAEFAVMLLEQERWSDAQKEYEEAVRLDPKNTIYKGALNDIKEAQSRNAASLSQIPQIVSSSSQDKFGAIAYSFSNHKIFHSLNQPSRKDAEVMALNACGKKDCVIRLNFINECAAIAEGGYQSFETTTLPDPRSSIDPFNSNNNLRKTTIPTSRSYFLGVASNASKKQAELLALEDCRKNLGSRPSNDTQLIQCRVQLSVCTQQ